MIWNGCSSLSGEPKRIQIRSNEISGHDYVLTGKKKGIGKTIPSLLKNCPESHLEDLFNDQFRLQFKEATTDDLAIQNCLKLLEKDFEIQKNRIYRLDPVVKPGSKLR